MKRKISKSRHYRVKLNTQKKLKKIQKNPTENTKLIELNEIIQTETKNNILDALYTVENQLALAGDMHASITLSLLRRQFSRGDIDQKTLFYWLKTEGLI
jgi:hypothetical protein